MTFWDMVKIYTDIDSEYCAASKELAEAKKKLDEHPKDMDLKVKYEMLLTKVRRKQELKETIQRIEITRSVWEGLNV